MTVKELIKILRNYDGDTEVYLGSICRKGISYKDLFIEEFNQKGGNKIVLWIGHEDFVETDPDKDVKNRLLRGKISINIARHKMGLKQIPAV